MQFLQGRVDTVTDPVSNSTALTQIILILTVLGCAMSVFAAHWRINRG